MPTVVRDMPFLDAILSEWRGTIGADYPGYRNHVCRVVNFCFALGDWSEEQRRRIIIAGCFHDLGIWSAGTADYLPPSIVKAREYLVREGLDAWAPEIVRMIDLHHKLTRYHDPLFPLVEAFRRADFADVSLGMWRRGLAGAFVREVKAAFPNAGFHLRLVKLLGQGLAAHPLDPLPIFRW